MTASYVPVAVWAPIEEAADRAAGEWESTRSSAEFWRELHAAAIARWLGHGDEPILAALVRADPTRERVALSLFEPLTETGAVSSMLVALVEAHLRRTRPDMAPAMRWRLAWRAAQVGVCRTASDLSYADIAALPAVDATSVRPLKADYVRLLEAYVVAWRSRQVPSPVDLKALRGRLRR